jgi:hypothetical protein
MKKTLVILAGGLGSRFGGLKQIEPIGNNGEFIIDYSIYDAIQAGFKEVIFIIKKENYKVFKNTIGNRIKKYINVKYAFQPLYIKGVSKKRTKPLGTAHALSAVNNLIKDKFLLITADDFYGQNSFKLASEILKYDKEIEIISYKLGQTLTENGAVKRGICYEDENNNVLKIIESICERKYNKIIVKNLDGTDERSVDENMNVSMLMMTMNKDVLSLLNQKVEKFIKNLNGDLTSEILIPVVLNELLKEKSIKIKTKETDEKWYGITYREDLEKIKNIIKEKQEKGEYPIQLWK